MTAHVFVVTSQTFDLHLKYAFVGTGSKDHQIDFNSSTKSELHSSTEKSLVQLLADGLRLRKGDSIFFYVQQDEYSEGKFYGVFECVEDGCFLDNDDEEQFLRNALGKNLNIRALIAPKQIFPRGVSEWKLLDDISLISTPKEMFWSLIYRKLMGNRGNTMITLHEERELVKRLEEENIGETIISNLSNLEFNPVLGRIATTPTKFLYKGTKTKPNILPRLKAKFQSNQAFEAHLQAYLVSSILSGKNETLESSLYEKHFLKWIGNEVSCGVGMQRIDILTHTTLNKEDVISPIELKATTAHPKNLKQLKRYIDWLNLYYLPLMPGKIRPVLMTKEFESEDDENRRELETEVLRFNNLNRDCLALHWITYTIQKGQLAFKHQSLA